MGLAASQARFLGLTARKSNVEYQVQQINQQRVALSNEVMGLYNKYNRLEVPTPPVVNDFQKTTYKLDSTYQNYEIQSFTKITEGKNAGYYDVVLAWNDQISKPYTYTAQDAVVTAKKDGEEYSYLNFQFGNDIYSYDSKDIENSNITKITGDYEKYQGLVTIMNSQGIKDGTFYMIQRNGISYYTSENDIDSVDFDEKNMYYGPWAFDYLGVQNDPKSGHAIAALTQESSGRLSTIQVLESEDIPDVVGNTYSISTSQSDDERAYEQAMNDYYYEKQLYEREVEKINMETEEIQEQDRALEMQIAQLDTEQNALSTEMDSVKKVIEDTMEKVFKTFSG